MIHRHVHSAISLPSLVKPKRKKFRFEKYLIPIKYAIYKENGGVRLALLEVYGVPVCIVGKLEREVQTQETEELIGCMAVAWLGLGAER